MDMFRGINGTIILSDDIVQIIREKGIDYTFHKEGHIEIPYSEIKEVVFSEGGLINGYISIMEKKSKRPSGIVQAMKDENAVIFRMFKNEQAREIRSEIRRRIDNNRKT